MRRGVDVSNFSGAIVASKAAELRAAGYTFAIVGAQVDGSGHSFTQGQIDALRAGGIEVLGVYELLYWDNRDLDRMDHALSFGLPVWLDCESDPGNLAPEHQVVGKINSAVTYLGAKCAGIYTGKWWWEPKTGNSTAFAALPLWHAGYQREPFVDFAPYGGWAKPAIWQYSSGGLPGLNCDLNAMEDAPVPTPTDPTDDQLRLAAVQAMLTKYNFAITGTNPFGQTVVRLLEKNGTTADPPSFLALEVQK